MTKASDILEFECKVSPSEHRAAWDVYINDNLYYMPKSVCSLVGDNRIRIPRWLAKREGLVCEPSGSTSG